MSVLVISAYVAGHEDEVMQAGADGILRKPFFNRGVVEWLNDRCGDRSAG